MLTQELELEYNNRARVPQHEEFFALWENEARRFRDQSLGTDRAELGLAYGRSRRQVVDVFHPPGDTITGSMAVFVHGGYWQLFEPALFSHLAKGANAKGLSMAVVGYDLCPTVQLAEIIDQIRAACVFLHRRFGARLVVTGHSAGGHLTACMLATDWRSLGVDDPDLVYSGIAISGVFDLTPLLHTTVNRNLGLDESEARRLSPLYWPAPAGRTVDAVVGEAESASFRRQSRDFVEAWSRCGTGGSYIEIPGAHHFDVIAPFSDPESALVRRLVELAGLSRDRASGDSL